MKKIKIISIILCFAILFSVSGCFFADNTEEKYDFAEISYVRPDYDRFDELYQDVTKKCSKIYNALKVKNDFDEMFEIYYDAAIATSLSEILNYKDISNSYYADEFLLNDVAYSKLKDKLFESVNTVGNSPCRFIISLFYGNSFWSVGENSQTNPKLSELNEREIELIYDYNNAITSVFSIEDAELGTISEADIDNLLLNDKINEERYYELSRSIYKEKNDIIAPIFVEMIGVRNEIAKENGYDNYADYCYKELYSRFYTIEDISKLRSLVKSLFPDMISEISVRIKPENIEKANKICNEKYDNQRDESVKALLSVINENLVDSYDKMLKTHSCSLNISENKADISFTTLIPIYDKPYLFASPVNESGLQNFSTIFHEFGHYYQFDLAVTDTILNDLDQNEVISQGLELLASERFDKITDEKSYNNDIILDEILSILQSIRDGFLFDEFQDLVYNENDPTPDKINKIYAKLLNEYGIDYYKTDDNDALSWIDINHNFITPYYYISYAESAIVALEIFTNDEPVQMFLQFADNSKELNFDKNCEKVGLKSPIEIDTLTNINKTIKERYIND